MPTTRDIETRPCSWCGDDTEKEDLHAVNSNEELCDTCYDNSYTCQTCVDIVSGDDSHYCETCERDYCNNCSCHCEEEPSIPERVLDERTTRYIGAQHGTIVQSVRPFGVEIETIAPDTDGIRTIYRALPHGVGMSSDGSLPPLGIEIQTPKLAGLAGENLLKSVTRLLNNNACHIIRACGLHVHLDTADFTPKAYRAIARLWTFYIVFEDVLLSFLPHSRRMNNYCRLIRDKFHLEEINNAGSKQELERIWYRLEDDEKVRAEKRGKYHATRYAGLNLHAMFAMKHAEIRYHSGTTNAQKMLEWANLHARAFDSAIADEDGKKHTDVMQARYLTDIKKKTLALFDILGLAPASQKYFLGRQKLFANDAASDEAAD